MILFRYRSRLISITASVENLDNLLVNFSTAIITYSSEEVNKSISGGRSDLSVPRLRPSADSSPARSSPPLNPLRFSAFRPLRPPLPLFRYAQIGVARPARQDHLRPPRLLPFASPWLLSPPRTSSPPEPTPALSSAGAAGRRFAASADLRLRPRKLHLPRFRHMRAESSSIPLLVLVPSKLALPGTHIPLRLLRPPGPAPPGCRPFAGSGSAPWLRSARTSFRRLRSSGTLAASGTGLRLLRATSRSLRPSGPACAGSLVVPPPGNLPVRSRRHPATPLCSATVLRRPLPWQIALPARFLLRSLPGNLLPLHPSSASVAASATADRRACSRPLRAGSAPADCPPVRLSVCSLAAFGCMCSAAPQPATAGSIGTTSGSIVSRPPDRSFPLLRCIPLRRPAPGRSNIPFPRGAQARLRSIPLRTGQERLPHIASLCMWSLRPSSPHGSGVCGLQEPRCVSFRLCTLHRAALPVFAPKRSAFPCGIGISILFTAFTIHAD